MYKNLIAKLRLFETVCRLTEMPDIADLVRSAWHAIEELSNNSPKLDNGLGERSAVKAENMSLLIKGMKMPKNCRDCIWIQRDRPAGKVYCTATDPWLDISRVLINSRHDCCPLVEVPPHGRLVDADEMYEEFVLEGQRSTRYKLGEAWELNGKEIRRVIYRLPTIIPADEGE